MNIMHKLEMRDGTLQNVMYIYYPAEYEFSLDFNSIKTHVIGVVDKIRAYALENVSKFTNETVLLILNGVVIGSVMLTQLVSNIPTKNNPKNISQNISTSAIENLNNENIENPYISTSNDEKKNESISSENNTQNSQNTSISQTNT